LTIIFQCILGSSFGAVIRFKPIIPKALFNIVHPCTMLNFEFVCELCKMSGSHTNIDGAYNRRHPCRQLVSNALFHRVHGWTRYKSPAMFLRSKNSKFKNWHGCQFLNRIVILGLT